MVTAQLICTFVFAYSNSRFCHDADQMLLYSQIKNVLVKFIYGNRNIQKSLLRRLEEVREKVEESPFFMSHEV